MAESPVVRRALRYTIGTFFIVIIFWYQAIYQVYLFPTNSPLLAALFVGLLLAAVVGLVLIGHPAAREPDGDARYLSCITQIFQIMLGIVLSTFMIATLLYPDDQISDGHYYNRYGAQRYRTYYRKKETTKATHVKNNRTKRGSGRSHGGGHGGHR